MSKIYLMLAILGAAVPILFFAGLFHTTALPLTGFIPALFANPAAGGFTADLLISSVVFWLFMWGDQDGPKPWLYIVLNCCIGLSCALPAYLYSRSAALAPVPQT